MQPLDPSKAILNWPNAHACLERCELAYDKNPQLDLPSIQSCPSTTYVPGLNIADDLHTDAQAVILDEENCISVAFRGSQAPEDYIQDAKFELTELTDGPVGIRVHKGFQEDWCAIRANVLATLSRLLLPNPRKPIFVMGHSLGGALAIFAGKDFAELSFNLRAVYTFGQPRVGNFQFADDYDATSALFPRTLKDITFRVVNENDIVPRVPFAPAFRHCGLKIFLCCPMGVIVNPHWWETADSDSVGFLHAVLKRTDVIVGDHYLAAYQKRMANL
jgi:triacylglycerol lipase